MRRAVELLNTRAIRVSLLLAVAVVLLLLSSLVWVGWIPKVRDLLDFLRYAFVTD